MIHVDWHVGRPADMPPSLDWQLHWLLGVLTGVMLGWWFLRRSGPETGAVDLLIAVGLGVLASQVAEPALQVAVFRRSFAEEIPTIRWRLFAEFTLALLVSVAAVAVSTRLGRRAHNA